MTRGENPPRTENFQLRSLAVRVWSCPVRVPQPLHVTKEKNGLYIASGLVRSMPGKFAGGLQAGGVPQGTSNERPFKRTSCGSHDRTHGRLVGLAGSLPWGPAMT